MERRKLPEACTSSTAAEQARREEFARALTRSVFGRHYWNDKLEDELRASVAQSKKRKR